MTTDPTPLINNDDRAEARRAEGSIFADLSDLSRLFTSRASRRGLIYPTTYWLDQKTFEALRSAAATERDRDFYLALTEESQTSDRPDRWRVPFDFDAYRTVADIPLETAHYSRTGSWGVLTTSSDIALVGGSRVFVESFERKLEADFEEYARQFLSDYAANAQLAGWKTDWLSPMMAHLFGAETGSSLVATARI